ncbi:hypothetical protein [Clostridium algidicarnis]|uniref:hypothetical protein n=1 Tax=Clostridium algidicarnis TaxID=37659 RepID=UPI003FD7C985
MLNELNLLRKQNQTNTKELIDINQEFLSRILNYVQISKIGAFDREIIRKDLIGMAIEVEKRGKTLSDIIGTDEKSWCDSLVDSYGKISPIELILSILKQASIYWFIWGIVLFTIPNYIIHSVFGVTLVASTFLYNNLIHKQAKKINWME